MNPTYDQSSPTDEESRLQSLGEVAGELMHDLANVLAVVQGRASLALGDAQSGRVPTSELERIVEASDEMGRMLRDVLETLRGTAVSPEVVFAPSQVAHRVIRRVVEGAPSLEIRLVSSIPANLVVGGRASFLVRALQNLLGNAVRHARSQVQLRMSLEDDGVRRQVVLEVADDGPGIRADRVAELFRPLVQGEGGGTAGLGLSSTRWAVDQLGGEIECGVAVELGGASIAIRLPVVEPKRSSLPVAGPALTGRRLVLVENDPSVRHALERLLGRMGAEVVSVSPSGNEEETLKALLGALPDAILLDLQLGRRAGGEIWRTLKEQVPALAEKVIFLSGLAPGDPLWEAGRATGQRVLPKPFDLEALANAVAEVAG
jgi:CheY-like chemotaxis protein/two-component sensor histidine kinase